MKNLSLLSLLIFCSLSLNSIAQTSLMKYDVAIISSSPQVWNLADLETGQIIELTDISFAADETNMSEQSIESLEAFANFMKDNAGVKVEVRGHTNGIPPHQYCDELSQARAEAVVSQLLEFGVGKSQMTAMGYGKRTPRSVEFNATDRKSNQRVDIKILSL